MPLNRRSRELVTSRVLQREGQPSAASWPQATAISWPRVSRTGHATTGKRKGDNPSVASIYRALAEHAKRGTYPEAIEQVHADFAAPDTTSRQA
jgi:hypothetical protein